eukprot:3411672-Amphidinium_carterae.1
MRLLWFTRAVLHYLHSFRSRPLQTKLRLATKVQVQSRTTSTQRCCSYLVTEAKENMNVLFVCLFGLHGQHFTTSAATLPKRLANVPCSQYFVYDDGVMNHSDDCMGDRPRPQLPELQGPQAEQGDTRGQRSLSLALPMCHVVSHPIHRAFVFGIRVVACLQAVVWIGGRVNGYIIGTRMCGGR